MEFLIWCTAGAVAVLGLATLANALELALDLETS
jgi:hypothetical protein